MKWHHIGNGLPALARHLPNVIGPRLIGDTNRALQVRVLIVALRNVFVRVVQDDLAHVSIGYAVLFQPRNNAAAGIV